MNAIRITRKIDSDTLHLPELRPLIGRQVQIIVVDQGSETSADFWKRRAIDELAAAQGVTAMPATIEHLYGDFSETDFEGFEQTVQGWRESTDPRNHFEHISGLGVISEA